MKRTFAAMLALLCLVTVLTGCGGKEEPVPETPAATEAPAPATAAPATAEPVTPEPGVSVDWAQLEPEMGILTLRLPIVADSYYSWKWNLSDAAVAEHLTSAEENGEFVASFRGLADGECSLTLDYSCADALAEIRTLTIRVSGGKVVEILDAESVVMEGVREDVLQPEIMEVHAANRVETVLDQYNTLTIVSESWDVVNGEEVWTGMTVEQYDDSTGALVYNQESEVYELGNLYVTYREEESFPNVYCTYNDFQQEAVGLLLNAAAGREMVQSLWPGHGEEAKETLVSIDDNSDYNVRVMTTAWESVVTGYRNEYIYFIDLATGLITGMENNVYDMVTGEKVSVKRSNVFYDDYRTLEPQAAMQLLESADVCTVTFVADPGEAGETSHTIAFRRHAEVGWYGLQEYAMYADAACTQTLDRIDTAVDSVTVYLAKAN